MQLYPCLLNITEQKTGNIVLFKKISHYAVLASGLGNPNEKPVRSPHPEFVFLCRIMP